MDWNILGWLIMKVELDLGTDVRAWTCSHRKKGAFLEKAKR